MDCVEIEWSIVDFTDFKLENGIVFPWLVTTVAG